MAKTYMKQIREELQKQLPKATITLRVFNPTSSSFANKVLYVSIGTDDDVIKIRVPLIYPTGATSVSSTAQYVRKLVVAIKYSYLNQLNFRTQQQGNLRDP